jgi:lysozyme family protein
MTTNFDKAFAITVGVEGGYQSPEEAVVRKDPGGETKYGVCKRDFPSVDIKSLTMDQAKAIYQEKYWSLVKGDQLPWPLCACVFDAAVNQGVIPAIKMLQKVVKVPQTGILDVGTMSKVKTAGDFQVANYMAQRTMRYTGTRNFDVFGEGWFTRLFTVMMQTSK